MLSTAHHFVQAQWRLDLDGLETDSERAFRLGEVDSLAF